LIPPKGDERVGVKSPFLQGAGGGDNFEDRSRRIRGLSPDPSIRGRIPRVIDQSQDLSCSGFQGHKGAVRGTESAEELFHGRLKNRIYRVDKLVGLPVLDEFSSHNFVEGRERSVISTGRRAGIRI
jgi:hypothetical protein